MRRERPAAGSGAQEAAREREALAHAVLNALRTEVAVLDEAGTIVAVNRAWLDFGLANDADAQRIGPGVSYLEVCERGERAGAEAAHDFCAGLRAVMSGEQREFAMDYPFPTPSELRWFLGRVTRAPGDGPTYFAVAHEDITERKRAEDALREEKERLRLIVSHSPDVMFFQDRALRYTWIANPAPPLTEAQAIGKTDLELFGEAEGRPITELKRRVLEAGVGARRDTRLAADGEWRYFETAYEPLHDAEGRVVGLFGYAHDITDRKAAEAERERLLGEVQRRAAELDSVIASAAVGLMIYGPGGEVLRINPAAERILGYREEERGRPLAERLARLRATTPTGRPIPLQETPPMRALRGERVLDTVAVFHLPDGREVWTLGSAVPIPGPRGRPRGAVLSFSDITAQHQLEEQRQDILRAVSHDLRNPWPPSRARRSSCCTASTPPAPLAASGSACRPSSPAASA